MDRKLKERLLFLLFRACALLVIATLVILVGYVIINGIGVISWSFLTEFPRSGFTEGGIFPAIMGTIYLIGLVLIIAVPIGVLTAVYVVEYSDQELIPWSRILARIRSISSRPQPSKISKPQALASRKRSRRRGSQRLSYRTLRIVITNLAGVPSIVYGLLGFGALVIFFNIGMSLIASGITLAFLVLPLVITASREAIEAVPASVREASTALGATKWQTIRSHVLPYSIPGIMTGMILSLSRAAGETAPILLTGAVVLKQTLPDSIFSTYMALPYQLYALATQYSDATRPMQYGSALVLLLLVVGMNLVAIFVRNKYRAKYRW
jgi:phosphate transport system permease protein